MFYNINKINFLNKLYFKKNQNHLIVATGSNIFTYLNNLRSYNLVLDVVGYDSKNSFFSLILRNNKFLLSSWFFSSNQFYHVFDNWMFREYNEFFSNIFLTYSDNRNLLLDYNIQYKPLKKNFPTIGLEEVYYDFSKGFICYVSLNSIEL